MSSTPTPSTTAPDRTADADEFDVDVVVVGAGGGGLAAALAASDAGASVVVLEKLDAPGGNTALSTGSIPAAGSRFQREAGVDDDPDRMTADLIRQSGPHEAEHLTRRLAETSASLVEWLVDDHGVGLALITDYKHVGHSVTRLHAPVSRRGIDLSNDLVAACRRAGVDVVTGNPVTELLVEDGVVRGVVVEGERTERYVIRARSVVLAANGFAANRELVQRWAPELAGLEYFGAHGSTGEAIEWGVDLGGRLRNQAAFQGYAAVAYPHGSILSWTTVEKGGVLVDARGVRLGDEIVGYSGFATEVLGGTAPIWAVYDARIRDITLREDEFADLVEMGGAKECATVDDLARVVGVDVDALRPTLEAYAAAARGESADEHGRTDFGMAPLEPPYVASRVSPGLFHTQGGLDVDGDGRVLRDDGVVPGLFAVGGVAAGVSGQQGGRGYSSGNGLLTAVGLGRLAGTAAAAVDPA
ncbi:MULTISPECIES: FAD-dependent oxidoreductase [Aeromicrobium]|uniref:FAD-dependent oxidoreductase n=1 Tax=Aeromicrobium TaxID=2040 RepID=UPI0007011304|nr:MULTISPECIES: FAD-dependent oxidoreductase [Aeromicrobium]KQX74007.1 fumarate reductase [Aeromicrobium sp. Root472D3]MCL8250803.1 FAD-dependent oxidoreductase [Aeromicrobium fastidiosum]